MLRACALAVVVLQVMACGKGGGDKAKPAPAPAAPIAIRFGACAAPTVAWVSGPKPLPFTPDEAAGVYAANDVPPPEEPEPSDEEQRKARQLAIEQARTAGALGSVALRGDGGGAIRPDDAQRARQQAIEQARAAGILGNDALRKGGAFASLTAPDAFFDGKDIYDGQLPNEAGPAPIGLGTMGYRVGGKGTPSLAIGSPAAQGDLDKALIRRIVRQSIPKIQYCYEKQLLVKPSLRGTVMAHFFIAVDGHVASSHAGGLDPIVANCVADVIKALEFPKPKGGGGVQVNYPFTFRPADDDDTKATTASPPTPSPTTPTTPQVPPGPTTPTTPQVPSSPTTPTTPQVAPSPAPPTPPTPSVPRALFRPPTAAPVNASTYRPGDGNPLRVEEAALEACFQKQPSAYGAAIVELGYDAAGAVTAATVQGIDDAGMRDCVAAVAKRVKRTSGTATAERCSFAFGEMPDTALPAIDITADAISYRGKPYTLAAGDRTSEALTATLAAELAPILSPTGLAVSIRDPRALHPIDTAKMRDVNAAIASVIRAGDDVALAVRRGNEWTLFTPMTLPTVPVPFGTGGRWLAIKTRAMPGGTLLVTDDRVQLSILVERDRTWIGLSRVNEFTDIPTAEVADKLVDQLMVHKASAFFALEDRVDLEIAGSDDATYGQVVQAIDAAVKVGFTGWQFAMPEDISAKPQR